MPGLEIQANSAGCAGSPTMRPKGISGIEQKSKTRTLPEIAPRPVALCGPIKNPCPNFLQFAGFRNSYIP
jgi:hypothetical protein